MLECTYSQSPSTKEDIMSRHTSPVTAETELRVKDNIGRVNGTMFWIIQKVTETGYEMSNGLGGRSNKRKIITRDEAASGKWEMIDRDYNPFP
jgi:hypothetical protein